MRIMMALTDRQAHKLADLGSGFFPVYRSRLTARPLLEALLLDPGNGLRFQTQGHRTQAATNSIYLFIWTNFWFLPYWISTQQIPMFLSPIL